MIRRLFWLVVLVWLISCFPVSAESTSTKMVFTEADISILMTNTGLPLNDAIRCLTESARKGVSPSVAAHLIKLGNDWSTVDKHLEKLSKGKQAISKVKEVGKFQQDLSSIYGVNKDVLQSWVQLGATNKDLLEIVVFADLLGVSLDAMLEEARNTPWQQVMDMVHRYNQDVGIFDPIKPSNKKNSVNDRPATVPTPVLGQSILFIPALFRRRRSKATKTLTTMLWIAIILSLFLTLPANAGSLVDPSSNYDSYRTKPFQPYFENLNESINPATGSLTITQTDLVLPGRQGLDLRIARIYSSSNANVYKQDVSSSYELRTTGWSYTDYSSSGDGECSDTTEYHYRVDDQVVTEEYDYDEDGNVIGGPWYGADQYLDVVDNYCDGGSNEYTEYVGKVPVSWETLYDNFIHSPTLLHRILI